MVFDEKFVDFDFNDFSNEAYLKFLDLANITDTKNRNQLLTNLNFLRENKLNYSGVLFFSKDVTKYLRNAIIQCVFYQGSSRNTILDKKEFSGDLVSNYFKIMEYIKSHLNTEYLILDANPRKEILELPENAIKEALINAIAHRDYFSNAPILVNIYKDKLEILNPIIMDSSLELQDLLKGSYPKNLFLFSNLERIDLVEKAGSGFIRIKKAMEQYKLPMLEISFSKRLFEVIFKRPDLQLNSYKKRVIEGKGYVPDDLEKDLENMTDNQRAIVVEIRKNKHITQKELSEIIRINEKNIRLNIKKLKENGIIERIGADKGGYWEVKEKI
ncbi:MAG: winged helix-turn-helix transcriptional regulator [Candidatus Aenigmarchaeota archaeon]|nr:winged helix-turn-helix transcriptional regulator [Candidatus Aenigmarchaeota archaeon]